MMQDDGTPSTPSDSEKSWEFDDVFLSQDEKNVPVSSSEAHTPAATVLHGCNNLFIPAMQDDGTPSTSSTPSDSENSWNASEEEVFLTQDEDGPSSSSVEEPFRSANIHDTEIVASSVFDEFGDGIPLSSLMKVSRIADKEFEARSPKKPPVEGVCSPRKQPEQGVCLDDAAGNEFWEWLQMQHPRDNTNGTMARCEIEISEKGKVESVKLKDSHKSNSLERAFRDQAKFVTVKFNFSHGGKQSECDRTHGRIMEQGLYSTRVARHFQFFTGKGNTDIFVAGVPAESIRAWVGKFDKMLPSQINKRLELPLSDTVGVLKLCEDQIQLVDDIMSDDGACVMTDGCGWIGVSLSPPPPHLSSDGLSRLAQFYVSQLYLCSNDLLLGRPCQRSAEGCSQWHKRRTYNEIPRIYRSG